MWKALCYVSSDVPKALLPILLNLCKKCGSGHTVSHWDASLLTKCTCRVVTVSDGQYIDILQFLINIMIQYFFQRCIDGHFIVHVHHKVLYYSTTIQGSLVIQGVVVI